MTTRKGREQLKVIKMATPDKDKDKHTMDNAEHTFRIVPVFSENFKTTELDLNGERNVNPGLYI